jgi:ankyrin repeat protein
LWYAYSNNIEGSQFLFSKGVDVNAVNDEGSTALDIAERFNNQPMAQYLKSVGGKKSEK